MNELLKNDNSMRRLSYKLLINDNNEVKNETRIFKDVIGRVD